MSAPSAGGASRDGYGSALLRLASDPRVVVLEADLGKSTKSCLFREANPERTVSLGIAEQNMILVGAGMASSGRFHLRVHLQFSQRGDLNKLGMVLPDQAW